MPFGSLAPDMPDDDDQYYDPGTGMRLGGTDKYQPPKPWMLEPDLAGSLMGQLPQGVSMGETGPVVTETGEPVTVVRRPGVLPFVRTPEGGIAYAKPKIADIAAYTMRGPLPVEAEAGAMAIKPPTGLAKAVGSAVTRTPEALDLPPKRKTLTRTIMENQADIAEEHR